MEVEEFAVVRTDLEEGGEQQMKEVKKDTLVADNHVGPILWDSWEVPYMGDIESFVGHQYHHNYLSSSLRFIIISITIVKRL